MHLLLLPRAVSAAADATEDEAGETAQVLRRQVRLLMRPHRSEPTC